MRKEGGRYFSIKGHVVGRKENLEDSVITVIYLYLLELVAYINCERPSRRERSESRDRLGCGGARATPPQYALCIL
jgi:hypothetical protein